MIAHPTDRDWDRLDALVDEDPIALRDAAWRLATALTAAEHRADEAEARIKAVRALLDQTDHQHDRMANPERQHRAVLISKVRRALDGEQ